MAVSTLEIAGSMHDEIGVPRVFGYILLNRGTHDVDSEVTLPGILQGSFCQGGGEAHVAQLLGNFGMG